MTEECAENRLRTLGVVREFYARVAYTHKTHEKDRELWSARVCREKWANVILIGLTTAFAAAGVIRDERWAVITASILGAASTMFVIYTLSFDSSRIESEHRNAAKRLLSLRDRYTLLILKAMQAEPSVAELQGELQVLQTETNLVYDGAPDTSAKAYRIAGQGIREKEELTFSDEEIDKLLPPALRGNRLDAQGP